MTSPITPTIAVEEELPILDQPNDGIPDLTDTQAGLDQAIEKIATASGPVAVDTERAHGYRYGASAWLIQLRRGDAGTFLIDPMAFGDPADLGALNTVLADTQWVLHAATQDLPCLREVNLIPTYLFDTEVAGRLLNFPKVGLGALIEQEFGLRLLKEHSAADWSTRPLPTEWLNYAALDVELLVGLQDILSTKLIEAGRLEWAHQEFAAIMADAAQPKEERIDPWRRTSGIHHLKTPAQLAVVRELWYERDEIARRLDKGPNRILPDTAIAAAAQLVDTRIRQWPTRDDLRRIDGFKRRNARRFEANWLDAIEAVKQLHRSEYPPRHLTLDGPPQQPRSWEARHPERYARWLLIRPCVVALSETIGLPTENLCSPSVLRELAWQPPAELTSSAISDFLLHHGARPWQCDLVAGPIASAMKTIPAESR